MKSLMKDLNLYEFAKKYFLKSYMRLLRAEYQKDLKIYMEFKVSIYS